jgi:tripartite-type tricarboxylate transporter receptor subunit TctC
MIGRFLVAALATLAGPAFAETPEEFYAGKQVTIICGSEAGSGYDAYARLFAQHLGRFIPGHPTLLVQNMPGAGTLVATNYLANVAPKDGTVIATVNSGMAAEPLFHPDTAKFDPRTINWLGSPTSEVQLIAVSPTARVQKFAQVFDTELVVAGTGGGTTIFPTLLNGVLGTKFKVVKGYAGANSGLLAFERGEVEGMGADTLVALTTTHGDLVAEGKARIIAHYALHPYTVIPNIDSVMDYAKTPEQKAALLVVLSRQEIGRPYLMAAGVPADRVAAMRKAFAAAMVDPTLRADADKRRLEFDPVSAERIAEIVAETYAAPQSAIEKAKAVLGNQL